MTCFRDRAEIYEPMLSNFQVTVSVWFPARLMVGFAASVNTRPVVLQVDASAVQSATVLYDEELRVPLAPVAFVQVAAFHVTSPATHVVAPATGGVKEAALPCTDTFSCFVAVPRTMLETVTDAPDAAVGFVMLVTLKLTPAGTVTVACSLTFAVSSVV